MATRASGSSKKDVDADVDVDVHFVWAELGSSAGALDENSSLSLSLESPVSKLPLPALGLDCSSPAGSGTRVAARSDT